MPRNDEELQDQNNNQGPTLNIQLNTKQQNQLTMNPPASFAPGSPQLKLADAVVKLWEKFSEARKLKNGPTNSSMNIQIAQNGDMSNPAKGNNASQYAGQFMNMLLQNSQLSGLLNPNNAQNLANQLLKPNATLNKISPISTKPSAPKPGG